MPGNRLDWDRPPPPEVRGAAVCVGNFDGVHLGHAALLRAAAALADRVAAVTFDPHPLALLAPERFQPPLTTAEARAALLAVSGADHVVILRTTPELLRLDPITFFQTLIRDHFQAAAVAEGFNFRFGHGRAGDNQLLAELCRRDGIAFRECPPFALDGETVSSSRVRSALTDGDPRRAARFLGRPYALSGVVTAGQRRGRTLGFPTANLEQVRTLIPAEGVYAVRGQIDGRAWPGAANVGPNPTFGEQERKLEVHLIGFDGDIYGRELEVEFVERLRGTRPFSGVEELVKQVRDDIAEAGAIIGRERES